MMNRLTRSQGEALLALVGTMRKDWDLPGIRAAIQKATEVGPGSDVIVAAVRVAANPEARTPALIAEPGTHWQGLNAGRNQAPVMCDDHPDQPAGRCKSCATYQATPEQIATHRQRARQLAARTQEDQ